MTWNTLIVNGLKHVLPSDERTQHRLGTHCPCQPYFDPEDETVLVHHSYDGRGAFECGERKPS